MRHIFWFASIILMLVPALGPARADAPAGGWQWARSLGGANADRASGMAMDRSGNVYVTGTFEKTIRIGLVTLNSGQYTGLFVAKYDPTGVLKWATAATGSRGRSGNSSRGDAERLLQRLDPLRQLEHRDALELLDPLLGCCSSHL